MKSLFSVFHFTVTALAFAVALSPAHAGNIKARCDTDTLNTDQALQRNAWAEKCGHISAQLRAAGDASGLYVTFLNISAPFDVNAPCVDGAAFLGMCTVAGCYTPEQRVMFNQSYVPISVAGQANMPTVTALSDSWLIGEDLPLKEEPIGSFVVGDEKGTVLLISLENGMQLEVTKNHPLVDHNGNILAANKVAPGSTTLLTTAGPSKVAAVTPRSYTGLVWNIEPKSTRTRANIHVAEGFVTGSVRYQNEWAEEASRLNLRDTLDVSAF